MASASRSGPHSRLSACGGPRCTTPTSVAFGFMPAPLHAPVTPMSGAGAASARRDLAGRGGSTASRSDTDSRSSGAIDLRSPETRGSSTPSAVEIPDRQLEEALTDLGQVLGVYPFRTGMPACNHCVTDSDLRMLSLAPSRIPGPTFDRYVTKSLITWGEVVDFKRMLPEILTRLTTGRLASPDALVGARLRRAGWLDWPAAEAPAVRRALRATWLTTLATAPAIGRAPITHRLGLITGAEDDVSPYLDLWEDRLEAPGDPDARLAAVLQLADLLAPLALGGRRRLTRGFPLARRGVVGQLDHWLRQPLVVQRLAHASDALRGTDHDALVTQARLGLARLRTDG